MQVLLSFALLALTAILALGPARALLEAQRRLGEKRAKCSFAHIHVDGFRLESLGASDDALAAVCEVGSNARDGAEHEHPHRKRQNSNDD